MYAIGLLLPRAGNLLVLPVLAALLSADAFGLLGVLEPLLTLLVVLAVCGQGQAVVRLGAGDRLAAPRLAASAAAVSGLLGASVALLAGLGWGALRWLAGGVPWSTAVLAALATVPLLAAFQAAQAGQQAMEHARRHTAVAAVRFLLGAGLGLLAVALSGEGAAAWLCAAAISYLLVLPTFRFGAAPTWVDARRTLALGAQLLPHAAAGALFALADRAAIVGVAGPAGGAAYVFAAKLSSAVLLLGTAFQRAFAPVWQRARAEGRPTPAPYAGLATVALAAAALAMAARPLTDGLSGGRYRDAAVVLPALCLGQTLRAAHLVGVGMALDDLRNARLLGLVALPPALLLSALAPAVARHGGAEGVAWAQAAAQGLALAGTALLLVRTKRTTGSSRSSALR